MYLTTKILTAKRLGASLAFVLTIASSLALGFWRYGPDRQLLIVDAAGRGNIGTMKLLLMSGAKVDGFACQTPSCLTPLSAAALYGRTDAARLLLDRGADVNQPLKRGQTALMYAAHYGHVDTVRLLLSRGANVGAECDSMTALEYAKRRGSTEIIDLLTKAGATR